MFVTDIVIFVMIYLLICVAGYYQVEPKDKFALVATVLLIAQALNIVLYLSFQERFDILSLSLAACIWVHHWIIHRKDDFKDEYTLLTFQLKDIQNHETWIVACVTAAITWFFASV